MTVAAADVHQAVNALWDSSGLDAQFTALWDDPTANFPVLHDGAAAAGQPMPYCVFEGSAQLTVVRQSGETNAEVQEVQDVPFNFRVHARTRGGDARTSKGVAAAMAEEIMKVFGGHPTVAPSDLSLDNGNYLTAIKTSDYGVREGDDEAMWVVSYVFRIDVPVMT
jgi:hypothetical protein